ncbi:MAG: M48 family metallopeptidase [Cypionkella sp.]|nr:M48 family metallopeptidase [Cypionkella sp.]
MLKLIPLLLPVVYALLMLQFSVWRTKSMLAANSQPLREPSLIAALAPLAAALGQERITVNVYDIPAINGLAAPDGQIYLTSGFVDAFRAGRVTAPELAAVVAHELGHVALGHMRRRMIDFTGQNAAFVMLSAVLGRFLPIIGIWAARALSTALMARLSQRDEFEADEFAAALMVKSGYGTGPQISLFQRLDALTGGGARPPEWMASHPKTQTRIAAIKAAEARWGVTQA